MYRKNTASQFFSISGIDTSTGGIKSGVSWTVRRCIDGTFAAAGGTATEDGSTGGYKFAMTQADTNGNNISFFFTGTGAIPQTVNIVTDGSPPDVNLKNAAGTAVTLDSNNVLNVSTKYLAGTALTGRDIGASVLLSSGSGTGQITLASGAVTVGTNNDKTGYSLTQTFPTNFSALGITAGGHISNVDTLTTYTGNTVQTGDAYARIGAAGAGLTALGDTRIAHLDADVSSRMATFTLPSNFSALGISVGGHISNVDTLTTYTGNTLQTADVANVKTKTDQLTFTSANKLDCNILMVNSVTVNGDGAGTPWGP